MRINQNISKGLLASGLILLTGLNSCKKDSLDLKPTTQLEEEIAFATPERVLAQVNGLYDGLKSGNFLGGRYLIYNDIRGEEFINRLGNGVTGLQTWNHTLNSSTNEVENLWGAAYSAINRVNLFLKGLNDNKDKGIALSDQYTAEAKFIRALCYYDLLTLYAQPYTKNNGSSPGLPLRLLGETTTQNNDLARSSVSEIYTQILADLNDAEAKLPVQHASSALNVTRAHRNTAIALKTRIYLSMGKYNEVITEASKIVSSTAPFQANSGVLHKLEASVATPFTNYTTLESVFSLPMTDGDPPGTQNQLGYYFNKPGVGNGEYTLNSAGTNGILKDTSWKATDARKTNFIEVVGTATYVKKFNKPSPYIDYVPVIRYAEILLNYAEAAAQTGNLTLATDLLNAVRKRSDPTYNFSSTTTGNQTNLINIILIERRIELLSEGFRSIDILRTGKAIPSKGSANSIQPSQSEYIWPIPNSELLANKLMTPN